MATLSNQPQRIQGDAQTFLRNLTDAQRKDFIIVQSTWNSRFSKNGEQQLAILGADDTSYLGSPKDYHVFDDGHRQIGIYDNSAHSLTTVWKRNPGLYRMMGVGGPGGRGSCTHSFEDIFHKGAFGGYLRLSRYCIAVAELQKDGIVETEPFRIGPELIPLTAKSLAKQWNAYRESILCAGTAILSDSLETKEAGEQREACTKLLRDALNDIRQRPAADRDRALYLVCERLLSKPFDPQKEAAVWAANQPVTSHLTKEDIQRGLTERIQYVTPSELTDEKRKLARKLHRYLLTADARHGNDAVMHLVETHDLASIRDLPRAIQEPPDKPYYHEERFHLDCTAKDFPDAMKQTFESVGLKNAPAGLLLPLDDAWQAGNPVFENAETIALPEVPSSKEDVEKPISISRNAWESCFSVVDRRSERTEGARKYYIVPEAWVPEACQSDISYLLKRRMLTDEKVLDYVYDHRPADGEPFLTAVTDGIFDAAAARDDDGFIYLDEPWRGNTEAAKRIDDLSRRIARFRLDDFQDWQMALHPDAPLTMDAVRVDARNYISELKPARESDLSRGIAETIRSKDYDELHSSLDGFVSGEANAKKVLEKAGRNLRKER